MSRLILTFLIVSLLSACAPSNNNSGVQSLRSLQAQQLAEISRLDAEVRQLAGRVEEIEFNLAKSIDQTNQQLDVYAQRIPAPSVVPEDLLSEDEQIISKLQGEGVEILRTAFKQMRLASFPQAKESFDKFFREYSNESIDDNVVFWRAFTSQQIGSSDQAIVLFSDVFQKYPKSDRADDALFYLAQIFLKNGEKGDAQSALKKLLADYPGSSHEAKAREVLASIP